MAKYVLRLKDKGTFSAYAPNKFSAMTKIMKQVRGKIPKGSSLEKIC